MRKADEIRIGGAMNRRLSALEASDERRSRIRARIEREKQLDAPRGGRRLRMGLAFALIAALALSGAAAAAKIGLFELYGRVNERLSNLSGRAQQQIRETVVIETEEIGRTEAAIDDVYYDGQTLIASVRIDGGMRLEERTPTAGEMQGAQQAEYPDVAGLLLRVLREGDAESAGLCEEFIRKMERGENAGLVLHIIERNEDNRTDDGVVLIGCTVNEEFSSPDAQYAICEFEYPLPEEVQNRDQLNFSMGLRKRTTCYVFDGGQLYVKTTMRDVGVMRASVRRSETKIERYAGGGTCRGLQVRAEGEMSAASGSITLTAGRDLFDQRAVYAIYGDGQRLDMNYGQISEEGRSVTWTFYALGLDELPEALEVYLLYKGEASFYSHEENLRRSDVIRLNMIR